MKKKIIPIIAIVICIAVVGGIVLMNKKPVENVAVQEQEETSVVEATPEPVETLADNSPDNSNEQGNTTGYEVIEEPTDTEEVEVEVDSTNRSDDPGTIVYDPYEYIEPDYTTVEEYLEYMEKVKEREKATFKMQLENGELTQEQYDKLIELLDVPPNPAAAGFTESTSNNNNNTSNPNESEGIPPVFTNPRNDQIDNGEHPDYSNVIIH